MLEQLIGVKEFRHCTLVTTKWGCTNRADEEEREEVFKQGDAYFGTMLKTHDNPHQNANIRRFDPKSKGTALEIIYPYLENAFVPDITKQMVHPQGPKLALGKTGAGEIVANGLDELEEIRGELAAIEDARKVLTQKYDVELFEEFKQKRKRLRRHLRLRRGGRWVMRTTIVGGAITATVLTLGPGAAAFVLYPAYEKVARGQKREDMRAKETLKHEFEEKQKKAGMLKGVNSDWLWDSKVKNMEDLESEGHSVLSASSDNLPQVAKEGQTLGSAGDLEQITADLDETAELSESSSDLSDIEK